MNHFSELPLCSALSTNLTRNGFVTPTPVQAQAIPAAFTGRDVVATAQTGTGKTLAFALPILESLIKAPRANGVRALVLSPTRELALQIQAAFDQLAANTGIRTAVVVGGLNEGSQLRAIRGGASIVIATPGRLCDFIDRRLVRLSSLSVLVLDEADRMLDMGFLPSLRRILSELPASRQTLFFSATIEPSVAHLVDSHLKNPVRIAVDPLTKPAENVALDLYEVEQDGKAALLHQLIAKETGSVLVFARTKHGADKLAKNLVRAGVKASRIHGDRTQNQRNEALSRFQRGECQVLVATDIAARGIHVDAIAHVINYDLPQVPEDFIHRVGRTGRAGASGVASTFVTRAQRSDIARIEKTMKLKMQRRPYTAPPQPANVIVLPVKPAGASARSFTPRTRRAR
jgi:ATP-dependent RNA helicase RhlE